MLAGGSFPFRSCLSFLYKTVRLPGVFGVVGIIRAGVAGVLGAEDSAAKISKVESPSIAKEAFWKVDEVPVAGLLGNARVVPVNAA